MREQDFKREFNEVKLLLTKGILLLNQILDKGDQEMATIQDVLREVQETKGVTQSALAFIQGLKDQIQQLIDAGAGATPEQLQTVVDELNTNEQALAAAITTEPTP